MFFLQLFLGWECCTIDALGLLGGILSTWNPKVAKLAPFFTCVVILLEGYFKDLNQEFKILNCYDPYSKRQMFWDEVVESSLFDPLVIIGKDINLVLSTKEIWGSSVRLDPMSGYFINLFNSSNLLDIVPCPLFPTWSNRRSG